MDEVHMKTLSLACPSCGGRMELSPDGETALCPYCGHKMLIEKEDSAQEEYERRIANARAEEDIKDLKTKRRRMRRFKGWLIALCVIAGICLINVFIPDSPMHELAFPRTADPFTIVSIKFSGMSGEGRAELQIADRSAAEYADTTRFEVTNNAENLEWLNDHEGGGSYTRAAEFLSDFHSPVQAAGAWEPDEEYKDYQWWLARTDGGDWEIVDYGY